MVLDISNALLVLLNEWNEAEQFAKDNSYLTTKKMLLLY